MSYDGYMVKHDRMGGYRCVYILVSCVIIIGLIVFLLQRWRWGSGVLILDDSLPDFPNFEGVGREEQNINSNIGVTCMVLTTQDNWPWKARAVQETWGKRCYRTVYYYSMQGGPPINDSRAIGLRIKEGRDHLTGKVMLMLHHAHNHFGKDTDWFFKADDDTYVIVENLKRLASQYDPMHPHYIGHRSMDNVLHGYNGGGAGYLLSREAVRLIVEEGKDRGCKLDGGFEDMDIGICLEKLQVYPIDTLDAQGKMRFHFTHPLYIFTNEGDARQVMVYHKLHSDYTLGNPQAQHDVMSSDTITFHYVDPGHMFMYDFLLYDLQRQQDGHVTHSNKDRS